MADMIYRPLGRTGLKVSIVGYGASPLGAEFGKIDPAEGTRAVHYAIDHGLNYFDVAPYYGRTLAETRLGQAMAGYREKVILATKVARMFPAIRSRAGARLRGRRVTGVMANPWDSINAGRSRPMRRRSEPGRPAG